MTNSHLTAEQHALNISGLLAIALVALVNHLTDAGLGSLLLSLAFAVIFVIGAYGVRTVLPTSLGPWSMLGLFVLSVASLLISDDTFSLILAVVLMASAPYHLTARQSLVLLLLANLCYAVVLVRNKQWPDEIFSFISYLALQGFALSSSLARQREVRMQETLARKNNELSAARVLMANQSRADERLRIAGDLHDTIGHQLTGLRLQLEALSHELPASLAPRVDTCKQQAAELLEEIRAIVRRMADDRGSDLEAAITELEALTPEVRIHVDSPLPGLPTALAQQLVFCFQEGVHNAIRHGNATDIEIRFADDCFTIADNGKGLRGRQIDPGFGLQNIATRLAPFNGDVELTASSEGSGCELHIRFAQGIPQ